MNSKNSITSEPLLLVLRFTDRLNLRRGAKSNALSNIRICYAWKLIKSSFNSNTFTKSAAIWNDRFELPDGSYMYPIFKNILSTF